MTEKQYCGIQHFDERFDTWFSAGVLTRTQFQNLWRTGTIQAAMGPTKQLARTPNTPSYQKKYTGKNGAQYEDVTYMRDGKGNIDFGSPQSGYTKWTDPEVAGSTANL